MDDIPAASHRDTLLSLNKDIPLSEKLTFIHEVIAQRYDFIARIAVALYDPKSDMLKTFIHSSGGAQPLSHYQAELGRTPSLRAILETGEPRVINDLGELSDSTKVHTQRILTEGYGSSYTLPMYINGDFFGFIFFNAYRKGVFSDEAQHYLDLFGHLFSLAIIGEMSSLRTLLAAIKTAKDITHHRDVETGAHLDRMSRYARLIAMELAPSHGFDDEFVEHMFMFAPLHDIGKIGIPDGILLKAGKLTEKEFEIMKGHTRKGREIIDAIVGNFGLDTLHHVDILRNIAYHHHEAMDGSGYPEGLAGEAIPIEARIVAVADVFDALTSRRSYKAAWTNEDAFATLQEKSGRRLDAACVEALHNRRADIEQIQSRFRENPYG